jgi:arginase
MGAGPLHLLKSGLAVRLEEGGNRVTIRSVELPPEFRATEIASAFELGAALARGVAEAVKTGAFPLVLSGNCGPAALGCVGGLKARQEYSGSTLMATSIHRKPLGAVFWTAGRSPQ